MSEGDSGESEVRGEYGYAIEMSHDNVSFGVWLLFSCFSISGTTWSTYPGPQT